MCVSDFLHYEHMKKGISLEKSVISIKLFNINFENKKS